MTAPSKTDVMGTKLQDYDIVWFGDTEALRLACIKSITVSFTRVNPAWNHGRSGTSIPRYITGTEDKILFVLNYGPQHDLNNSAPSMRTTRRFGCSNVLRVDDPYILNSNLAQALREKARKTKK